ncbi:unnamed protein product [Mytilus coruscus]|uniref:Uncharacterized protein n=1 Tax=Mytilus coruscus TaxID=42192 RepID=A0A6J8D3W0_MYTCO|nr:unnamed protein product [Mytilus coruscus]
MPSVQCPIPGCDYVTDELDTAFVATLITAHSTPHAPGLVAVVEVEKVIRPVISTAECCDEQLRTDLTQSARGGLTNKHEQEVLATIKKLAVRQENTMLARVTLHNMRQDRDEPSTKTKQCQVKNLVESTHPDIVIGTEIWIDSSIKDSQIFPSGYKIYRKDRQLSGGGVLIAIKDTRISSSVPELDTNCEIIWCK